MIDGTLNVRHSLEKQSLELMDNILHMGCFERFAWAGATAARLKDSLSIMLKGLSRPECQDQLKGKEELFNAYQAVIESPTELNWMALAKEAQKCLMEIMAKRMAICSALEFRRDEENYIDIAAKTFNKKRKLMENGFESV
jgi:hypothetical protein